MAKPTLYKIRRCGQLLGILQEHAPTHTTAQMAKDFHDQAIADHNQRDCELAIAAALVDGLQYGNWPWTVNRG